MATVTTGKIPDATSWILNTGVGWCRGVGESCSRCGEISVTDVECEEQRSFASWRIRTAGVRVIHLLNLTSSTFGWQLEYNQLGFSSFSHLFEPVSLSDVTRILSQIESGDPTAAEKLLPLVYDELRKLAAVKLAFENGHTDLWMSRRVRKTDSGETLSGSR